MNYSWFNACEIVSDGVPWSSACERDGCLMYSHRVCERDGGGTFWSSVCERDMVMVRFGPVFVRSLVTLALCQEHGAIRHISVRENSIRYLPAFISS